MEKPGKGLTLAFFLVFFLPFLCPAAAEGVNSPDSGGVSFPLIQRLDSADTGFRQFIADVEANRRRLFNRERGQSAEHTAESLTVYRYTPRQGEELLALAARCNIPYSALASLNRIRHPAMMEAGKPLLLPSCPGLFIPGEPLSDIEKLLAAARTDRSENESVVLGISAAGGSRTFRFFPGDEFSPTERAFFLNPGFRFPLRSFRLTSAFGFRENPVTGNLRLHQGLDLAAPEGTEVFAARDGIVTEIGDDPVYGIYIVLSHGENWASLYGHLQRVETTLRSAVQSGNLIGRVGSTGQSTGPHLHFELRQNGRAQDPGKLLFRD
jgi:murein DD-endopeptidase MepM/ murein hydrolase activator NlpD